MSQRALQFTAPHWITPSPPVEPDVRRELWHDADGPSIAGYDCSAPHPLWPYISSGINARIEVYRADRQRPWSSSMHLDLPNDQRTQWNLVQRFATQDEAARELADAVAHAELLFLRSLRGEEVVTPVQRRELAAQAAADSDPGCVAAAEDERAAEAAVMAAGSDSAWFALRTNHIAARERARDVRARVVVEFHRARNWREFVRCSGCGSLGTCEETCPLRVGGTQ